METSTGGSRGIEFKNEKTRVEPQEYQIMLEVR